MSDIDYKWHNLDETIAKYGRIERDMPMALKRTMTRAVIYAQGQIPPYPAPTSSGYRRTGTLGRVVTAFPGVSSGRNLGGGGAGDNGGQPLTRVEPIGGGVRGVIGGRLEYLPYVISEDEQARQHTGRWWTLQKVVRDAKGGMVKLFRADLKSLFE